MRDPKSPKRYRATVSEWEWFRTWFATDRCWVCDEPWQELHHIIPRSKSGDDDITNLAPLCVECHRRIEAREPVARGALRGAFMPSNYEYFQRRLGENAEGWLDQNYAPTKAAA